jgi:UDP-N-acetyl-D-mannosaminuronic acid dehydrogenase
MNPSSSSPASLRDIALIGCGVIGLPTALLLARAGHRVIGVDIDPRVVESINSWQFRDLEPEMQGVAAEPGTRERFSGSLEMPEADVYMIAAPTPLDHDNLRCDFGAVDSVVAAMLPRLRPGNLIILESTVPPLTCSGRIAPQLVELGFTVGEDVFLTFCPERVLPGSAYSELINNDRVIGGYTRACAEQARQVYASFVTGELVLTDCTTAELCKLAENSYRDVCVAFANELALVADGLHVDRNELIALANRHPRVDILRPGIGVGGHCLPIDPYFISEIDPDHSTMILAARRVNDSIPGIIAGRLLEQIAALKDRLGRIPSVAVFGLTYKPDTPDTRESPALRVLELLREGGAEVSAWDPHVEEYAYSSIAEVLDGADFVVVLVPHQLVLEGLKQHGSRLEARGVPVVVYGR